jgi:hypothetical protein
MLLYVPAGTPVAEGQQVELTIEQKSQAMPAGVVGKFHSGQIVRVDRQSMLKTGHLPIAVQFTA